MAGPNFNGGSKDRRGGETVDKVVDGEREEKRKARGGKKQRRSNRESSERGGLEFWELSKQQVGISWFAMASNGRFSGGVTQAPNSIWCPTGGA